MNQQKTLFSTPRIFNIVAVLFALAVIYAMSIAQEKTDTPAQEPTPIVTAETTAIPASGTPAPATEEKPAAETVEKPAEPPTEPTVGNTVSGSPATTPPTEPATGNTVSGSPTTTPATETFPVVPDDGTAPQSFADVPTVATDSAVQADAVPETEAEVQAPPVPFDRTLTFVLLVFAVILIGTYYLSVVLAVYWRLPDHVMRIFLLLFTFIGAIVAVFLGIKQDRLTLGIDLQGGVVLVYDVTWEKDKPRDVEQLVRAIAQRINPGGIKEIAIAPLGAGCNQLQVIIPKAEEAEVNRIERVISESGALTFRILASRLYPADAQIIQRGEKETGRDMRDAAGKLVARWVPAYEQEAERFATNPDIVTRQRNEQTEVLVKFDDGVDITGEELANVGEGISEKGERGVSFSFDSVGESKFRRLTRANQPDPVQARLKRQLGIILNDSLYSAPTIDAIIGANGIITFERQTTQEGQIRQGKEIAELIQILNAGALPADLNPDTVSRSLVGATLGADTIQKGKIALVISAAVVLLFMLVYYKLAGVIACFCVIANITMLVAVMLAFRAAFTLPGLAGVVLTIGMAVDANILIYERLREELRHGSSFKLAIHNAYAKAFSAIADSNITTLFTAAILYGVGTEQVKGFAVTLFLGIVLSMFTAIYCARTIMDIFEAQRRIKTFRMLQMFTRPNINFLGAGKYCVIISAVLMLFSVAGMVARGRGILNIDFVGGVSAEVLFHESKDNSQIRDALAKNEAERKAGGATTEDCLNDWSIQNVQAAANEQEGTTKQNTRFIITTSIPQVPGKTVSPEIYLGTVRNILKETFGKELVYRQFNYTFAETKPAEDTAKDAAENKPENGTENDTAADTVTNTAETEVSVTVFPAANQASVRSEIEAAMKKATDAKTLDNAFSFIVTRENFNDGSSVPFTDWTITAQTSKENLEKLFTSLKTEVDSVPYFPTSTTVGGSVARDTQVAGLAAISFSLIMMLLYIRVRFSNIIFGLVAVAGLIHTVILVLGCIALSAWVTGPLSFLQVEEFKIGLPEVAAFLTIIGYAINDTIILFDRIRENRGKGTLITGEMINNSINQTLSRTVLTSLTTLFVAVILYFCGGSGIHSFAFAMSLGVIFGTYSTIAFCSPLLLWLLNRKTAKA